MDDNKIDVYFIVESWLRTDDTTVVGELEGSDCRLISIPRKNRTGGGLCCLYKSNIEVRKENSRGISSLHTMEAMETTIMTKNKKLTVITIYRPGSTAKNRYPMSKFFTELNDILAYYNTYKNEVIFIGDFNIHVNNT
jgi:exonuclease III